MSTTANPAGGANRSGNRAAPGRRAWWQAAAHPLRHTTLRTKLVLAVVALVAVLGVVISLVSALFLQQYLVGQLDKQLSSAAQRGYMVAVQTIGAQGSITTGQLAGAVGRASGLPPGTVVSVITSQGQMETFSLNPDPNATQRTITDEENHKIAAVPVDGRPTDVDFGTSLGQYRFVAVQLPQSAELLVGLPLATVNATTAQLLTIILAVTVVGIVVAGAVGLLIVVLSLRPLERMAGTATAVSRLPLDRGEVALAVRVPEQDTDPHTEVGRLGTAFNNMLGHVASALTARQASENKVRQFVADASHELRTPLASIRGYAELTRRAPEALPTDTVHALGRIESEAERMTVLVEDLLLLARLDEGRELDRDPVDLSRLVIDAVSDAHAADRDHAWKMDLPPEPVTVRGDEPRLYQVIANLLGNARVHTPEGTTVTTELAVERAPAAAAGTAVVTVTDDGPGIPDDLQPLLFERFARGDSSRSRHTGSTGLGLAIVRAVVVAQGGTVSVRSEPGFTRFTVRLPLDESAMVEPAESESDAHDLEGVDDETAHAAGEPQAEGGTRP